MTTDPRRHPDRADTKAAKAAERAENAEQVWSEVDAEQKARDEKTERLKVARLAREAEIVPDASETKGPREP